MFLADAFVRGTPKRPKQLGQKIHTENERGNEARRQGPEQGRWLHAPASPRKNTAPRRGMREATAAAASRNPERELRFLDLTRWYATPGAEYRIALACHAGTAGRRFGIARRLRGAQNAAAAAACWASGARGVPYGESRGVDRCIGCSCAFDLPLTWTRHQNSRSVVLRRGSGVALPRHA